MSKAARKPQLPAVVLAQFDSDMTPKIWATHTDIDCNIKNATTERRDELALRARIL